MYGYLPNVGAVPVPIPQPQSVGTNPGADTEPECIDCGCPMSDHNNDECGGFCACGDCDGFAG